MFQRLGSAAAIMALALLGGSGTAAAMPEADARAAEVQRAPVSTGVLDVAHRGASAYAPENTLAAIDAAHEHEATTVELDVQRSKDGELVIVHDTTLARTTDAEEVFPDRAPYNVADFTMKEMRRLDAGSWFDSAYADERIPTLQEALQRLREHDMNLLLEIKSPALYPGIEGDIAEALSNAPDWLTGARTGGPDRLTIQSFDWMSTKRSHDRLPSVPHGLLGLVPEDQIDDYAAWADQINPNHTTIDADYVEKVHEADMEVLTYTVNNADDMRSAIGMGVDGIISDYPDVLRKVIAEER